VNKGGHDLSAALKYGGPLIFMTDGSVNRFAVANMYRKFAEVLSESNPDDFILLTGLANMGAIACATFGYIHGRLNLLIFKDDRYISRTIVLSELAQRKELH
jgi:hypothetical protein